MNQKRKDQTKKLERELILNKIEAREGVHRLVLILDHLKSGFNIGKIIRTAEAFSIREIHIIGTRFFDPYPAKGAIKRVKIHFFDSLNASLEMLHKENYEIFLMDMQADKYLDEKHFPKKSAFLFGNEEIGPDLTGVDVNRLSRVKIKQWGVTESLNVSVAASIAAYAYVTQKTFDSFIKN